VTETFLDGRVRIAQPESGFRSGLDAVMLAAAVPAQAGQTALELGAGTGTATHTLDGTSTMHLASADSGFTSEITVNTTIAGLKLPPLTADGARAWPAAGTITTEISDSSGGDTPDVLQIKITFNGTSKVTVTITVPGSGAATCTIDLASSAPSCQ